MADKKIQRIKCSVSRPFLLLIMPLLLAVIMFLSLTTTRNGHSPMYTAISELSFVLLSSDKEEVQFSKISADRIFNNVRTKDIVEEKVRHYLKGDQVNIPKTNSIPHLIHQSWKSFDIPEGIVPWVKTWTQNHPTWEYWFWTPRSVELLLKVYYPDLLDVYQNLPFDVQRADAMRYVVLYHFGGVYADLDMECLKPVDFWADNFSCVLPEEPHAHNLIYESAKKNTINAFLMSRPRHPLFKQLMMNLKKTARSPRIRRHQDIIWTTGPFYVQKILWQYLKSFPSSPDVTVVDPEYFMPTFADALEDFLKQVCSGQKHCSNTDLKHVNSVCSALQKKGFSNTPTQYSFANHHWAHSWHDEREKQKEVKITISDIVPEVKILKELNGVSWDCSASLSPAIYLILLPALCVLQNSL